MEEYQIVDICFASTDTQDIEHVTKLKNLRDELNELNEHLREYEVKLAEADEKGEKVDAMKRRLEWLPCCHTIESRIERDKKRF
jgi:hypothetical protein